MRYTIKRTFSFYGTKQECLAELGKNKNFVIEDFDESKEGFESCSGSYEVEMGFTKSDYSVVSSFKDWLNEQDDIVGESYSLEDSEGNVILTEDCL